MKKNYLVFLKEWIRYLTQVHSGPARFTYLYSWNGKKPVSFFLMLLIAGAIKPAYGDTYTWALTANGNGVKNPANANITLSTVLAGANLPVQAFGANGFVTSGNATKKGWNEANLTAAGSNDAFVELAVTLNCNVELSITAVTFKTKTSSGTITTANSQLQYSTDNFATAPVVVGPFTADATNASVTHNYNALTIGVLAGQTIKFRIYGAAIGDDNFSLSIKDFVITGTVSAFAVSAGSPFTKTCTTNTGGAQIGESSQTGTTYAWAPATGLSSSTASNPTANPGTTTTYTVTKTTTATGCTKTATVLVTVNTLAPTVSAGSPFTKTCTSNSSGAQIGEANQSGNTYVWSPSTGLSATNVSNPTANPNTTTTYTVTKTTTANGCTATATVLVTVNTQVPTVSAGTPFTKTCSSNTTGAQIGETNEAGNTYAWSPSSGLSATNVSNPTANPNATTTYTVTKTTTANGCTATATVLVTVNASVPTVSAGTPFTKTCVSNQNGSQIGETSQANHTYAWAPAAGLSSSTSSNPSANPATTTTYTVSKTNTLNGCSATATVLVTVDNTPPSVSAGSDFTKTCTTNPGGAQVGEGSQSGHTYSWSPQSGLSSTTSSNPNANPGSTTTYTVVKTKTSSGCTATATVTVTVNVTAPTVSAGTPFTKTCVSNQTGAQIGETSQANHTYAWAPSAGLSATNISDPIANPAVTTTYTVTKTRTSNGCTATATVQVTVNSTPPTVNAGTAFTKTCINNVNGAPIGETNQAGHTYAWAPVAGLSSTTVSNPTANPLTTTTYTVTKTNTGSGCTSTASVQVTVNNTPPTVNPGTPFTKTCVSNINGGTIGEANQNGNTYAWSPATGLSSSTLSNPNANPAVTTTYTVIKTTTSNGCTASGTVTVSVDLTTPVLVVSNDTLICSGSSINLSATGGDTYAWTPATGLSQTTGTTVPASPSTTQIYTVTGTTTSSGCTSTASIIVTVNQPSVAPTGIQASANVICDGQSITLTLQGGSLGTQADFKWYSGTCGGTAAGNGTSITVSPTTTNNQPLTIDFFVRAEGPAPCPLNTSCATFSATVNPIPRLNGPFVKTICSGLPLDYAIQPTFSSNVNYSWNSTAPGIISGNSQNQPGSLGSNNILDTLNNSTTNTPAQVNYNITLTFTNAGLSCSSDSELVVTVNPAAPLPDLASIEGVTGIPLCGGSEFLSFYIQNPGNGITYSWSADPPNLQIGLADTLQANNDSANVIISFPDLSSAYQATVHVQANNLASLGGCKSKEQDMTFNVTPGGITERLIVPRQPGNLLIYLDNSVDGYQWGYDSLPTLEPHFLAGQVYQILALPNKDTAQFFTQINGVTKLDTLNYLFWVLVYELNGNGDTCKTKVYYNGAFAKRPGPSPVQISPEVILKPAPNPSNGYFELGISGNIFGNLTMEVMNSMGQLVSVNRLTKTEDAQSYPVNLGSPESGIYLIRVSDDYGYAQLVKFLIY